MPPDVRIDYKGWSEWVFQTLRRHNQWPLPNPAVTQKTLKFWADNEFTRLFLLFNLPIEFIERSKTNHSDFTFSQTIWTIVELTYSNDRDSIVHWIIPTISKDSPNLLSPPFDFVKMAVYAEMAKMITNSTSFYDDGQKSESKVPKPFRFSIMRISPPIFEGYKGIRDFVIRNYNETCGDFKIEFFRKPLPKVEEELKENFKEIFKIWDLDLRVHGKGVHEVLLNICGIEKSEGILKKILRPLVQSHSQRRQRREQSLKFNTYRRMSRIVHLPSQHVLNVWRDIGITLPKVVGPTSTGRDTSRRNISRAKFNPYPRMPRHLYFKSGRFGRDINLPVYTSNSQTFPIFTRNASIRVIPPHKI